MVSRITFKDVKTNLGNVETYDIMNAIRNESSEAFQRYVPLANSKNIADVGAGILQTQALQNEFITALVDRIGLVLVRRLSLKNSLAKFKKGTMPNGRTIEEIFIDITKEHGYDPELAEKEVFKREIPDVKTLFHEENRRGFYKQTIQQVSLKNAFLSWDSFGDFIVGIINALYNSDQLDEYRYMMLLIDNYYANGLFNIIPVTKPTDETSTKALIKSIRKAAIKMTLTNGSRKYNAAGVHSFSSMDDLHLLITADLKADVDVDVLANAFNMDKTDFLGHVTVVDEFATPGLEAVLIDKNWFMVYDTHTSMESIWNPQGLYWNYYLHRWQILSTSRFMSAVAFVSGAVEKVTNVIIDPIKSSIKAGNEMPFTSIVKQTDDESYDVVYSVKRADGTAKAAATKFTDNVLTVASSEKVGELIVTATVTYDTEKTVTADAYVVVIE